MSSAPPELLLHILEYAYRTRYGKPNHRLLKACATVCKSWSGPAQSLLFRSVTRLDKHNIRAFHAAVLSSAALGNCVRTLGITMDSIIWPTSMEISSSTVAKLLQACPRVYDLSLAFHGVDLEEESLEMLRVAGQGLKALSLACYGSQGPILYQLLSIWPNIQFLNIRSAMSNSLPWGDGPTSVLQSNADNAGEVTRRDGATIRLHDLVLSSMLPPAAVAWLLASSADSLRTLELGEQRNLGEKEILRYILPCTPRLRSLRLWCYDYETAALLRMCTSLEELVFCNLQFPLHCPLVLNLPPTIKHLSVRVSGDRQLVKLQRVVEAVDKLPNLKVLTCNRDAQREHRSDFETLKWTCSMKGAEVVVSDAPTENWVSVMIYSNRCLRSS